MRWHAKSQFVESLTSPLIAMACLLAVFFLAGGVTGCNKDKPTEKSSGDPSAVSDDAAVDNAADDAVAENDAWEIASESATDVSHAAPWESLEPAVEASSRAISEPRYAIRTRPIVEVPPADAPVHVLTAEEIQCILRDHEDGLEKYEGSWVELSGDVANFEVLGSLASEVYLAIAIYPTADGGIAARSEYPTILITCTLEPSQRPWELASSGESVKVRGVLRRRYGINSLVECRIVEGGEPTPQLTIDEFHELYNADRADFKERYRSHEFIITGTFIGQFKPDAPDEFNDAFIVLESEDGARQYIDTPMFSISNLYADVPIGEELTVLALAMFLHERKDPSEALMAARDITEYMKAPSESP